MIIDDLIKSLIKNKFIQFRAVLKIEWLTHLDLIILFDSTSRDSELWKLNNQIRIKSQYLFYIIIIIKFILVLTSSRDDSCEKDYMQLRKEKFFSE
jgi:hypothetical protein